jgi:hypothetical protein
VPSEWECWRVGHRPSVVAQLSFHTVVFLFALVVVF